MTHPIVIVVRSTTLGQSQVDQCRDVLISVQTHPEFGMEDLEFQCLIDECLLSFPPVLLVLEPQTATGLIGPERMII